VEHALEPMCTKYLPASHGTHEEVANDVAPDVEYVPTLHAAPEHVDADVAPVSSENLPALHRAHAAVPASSENLPA